MLSQPFADFFANCPAMFAANPNRVHGEYLSSWSIALTRLARH
jgi:hypothetical protein